MADFMKPFRALAERMRKAPIDQELAVSEDSLFRKFNLYPYSPDKLITRKGFEIFDEMLRDDQIAQTVAARKTMLLAPGWSIEPASEDPQDAEVARYVEWNLRDFVDGTFDSDLWEIAGAGEFGWSIGEKVWTVVKSGEFAGRIALKAYKSKSPVDFNIDRDEFDNIKPDGVIRITSPQLGLRLPADKFVIYSYRKRFEDVFGTSILRSLYDLWWLKHILKRAWGVSFERAGVPVSVAKYPAGMKENDQNKLFKLVKSIRFESAAILPKDVELMFVESSKQGKDAMLEAIRYIDEQIVKTVLGQTLTQSQGDSGSQSLGNIHNQILGMYLTEFGRDMARKAIDSQIIRDIVDFNFSGITSYPRFAFKPVAQADNTPKVTAFLTSVEKGAVMATVKDEAEIRRLLGFPERAPDDKLLESAAPVEPSEPKPNGDDGKLPDESPEPMPSPTEEAESFQERIFTGVRRRSFTDAEKRVDFEEALRVIEVDGVEDLLADLGPLMEDILTDLLTQVQRLKIAENQDSKAIDKLAIRNLTDIKSVLKDGFVKTARRGRKSAVKELSAARKEARMAEPYNVSRFLPAEVEKLFADRAFTVTGIVRDDILKLAKTSLFSSVKNGLDFRDMSAGLRAVLEPYLQSGVVDSEVASGPRLETIVRTNVVDAFNMARRQEFMRDIDFVPGLQYSAILDDRVRDNHAAMDGRQYRTDDPIWDKWTPPNGFNCRCVLVPVTIADGDFKPSRQPPTSLQPDGGFKENGE